MTTALRYTLDHVDVLRAENERLNAQVARLQESCGHEHGGDHFEPECPICEALVETESDWLATHDARVRDDALEEAAISIIKSRCWVAAEYHIRAMKEQNA